MDHALISIHPKYVLKIREGSKTAEIRTRRVGISPGTWLWIYSTLPAGQIELVAKVEKARYLSPTTVWRNYSERLGISRAEFLNYANGSKHLSLLELSEVAPLFPAISLARIRKALGWFHPPQFFRYIMQGDPLHTLLCTR